MVECPVLEERHVELVGHQRMADVRSELRVPLDRWQIARAAAFVRDRPLGSHAERERRVMVEKERRDVIVVDPQQDVGTLLGEPGRERREVLEDRRPHGVVALVPVVGEADGRRMRGGDAADDACHASTPP